MLKNKQPTDLIYVTVKNAPEGIDNSITRIKKSLELEGLSVYVTHIDDPSVCIVSSLFNIEKRFIGYILKKTPMNKMKDMFLSVISKVLGRKILILNEELLNNTQTILKKHLGENCSRQHITKLTTSNLYDVIIVHGVRDEKDYLYKGLTILINGEGVMEEKDIIKYTVYYNAVISNAMFEREMKKIKEHL